MKVDKEKYNRTYAMDNDTHWDPKEVKHLLKKRLVQNNLMMLVVFGLLAYLKQIENYTALFGTLYICFLIVFVMSLYSFKTGKYIGTKTAKRLEEFEKERVGKKRWKRKRMTEAIFMFAIGVILTVTIIVIDFNTLDWNSVNLVFPFIGACIGINWAEINKMNRLKR